MINFLLECAIAYGSPPPAIAPAVASHIKQVCKTYKILSQCRVARDKTQQYRQSIDGDAAWTIDARCMSVDWDKHESTEVPVVEHRAWEWTEQDQCGTMPSHPSVAPCDILDDRLPHR